MWVCVSLMFELQYQVLKSCNSKINNKEVVNNDLCHKLS